LVVIFLSSADALVQAIQALCNERGLTINALARRAGLTQSTIDSIMKGKSKNPKLETLEKIASGFDMTVDEFSAYIRNFDGRVPKTSLAISNAEEEMLSKYRRLSDRQRKVVAQLIDLLIERS